ncbi:MAG: hypothetical protein AAF614_02180 [Chloroflexota bacterium]
MNRRSFLQNLGIAALSSSTGAAVYASAAEPEETETAYLPIIRQRTGGSLSLLVAAADAPEVVKTVAHFQCDGVDDQVQINQAIESLGAAGGLVQLSEGTFYCHDAVRLNSRITLFGKGPGTVLKAIGSWAAFDGSTPGGIIEPSHGGVERTLVALMTLHGNRYGDEANVKGVYYNITTKAEFEVGPDAAHTFRDLYIVLTKQHGFHIKGTFMRGSQISHVRVFGAGRDGESEGHGFLVECPDNFFSQCESGGSSGSGFYVGATNLHFASCKSWFSGLAGWQILRPRGQFAACEAQDNVGHGFYIDTGPTSLVGCHADSNSWNEEAQTAVYDGFHIPWGRRIQLIGCSAYDKNESNRGNWQRYGFYLGPGAEQCQVIGTAVDNAVGATGGEGATKAENLVIVAG